MALAGATRITCADVSKAFTDIARRFWAEAGVADRIELHLDGGQAVIARCLAAGEAGTFDLAFIDADKSGYDTYYEGALKLLRPGGLVLVDNTLWDGDVALPEKQDADTSAIRALNDKILADDRVEICLVPICDGLTMARKKDR
jgi:predicted O-methyltransferase YrrM